MKKATRKIKGGRGESNLRAEILRAAAALFMANREFSLRQVAEQIGYSATSIYLYFANKEELLFAICDQGFEVFDVMQREAYESSDHPLERLIAMGRSYIEFGLSHPAHYRVMFQENEFYLLSAKKGEEAPRMVSLLLLQQAVQEAIISGKIKSTNPQSTADALWAAVHGVVAFGNQNPLFDETRTKALTEAMLVLIRKGIL
jgi:AcrR family transcriptional regulator